MTTGPGPMTSPPQPTTATATAPGTDSGPPSTTTPAETGDPPPTTQGDGSTTSGTGGMSFIGFVGSTTDCFDPEVQTRCSFECDVWAQDCPEGEKCMPWSNDGGGIWNATRCSLVDPEFSEPGDPCVVEGSQTSGLDSCSLGQMCWDVDPDTNMGQCVEFCGGTEADPACPGGAACMVANSGSLALCLPTCDPLAAMPCAAGHSCHPDYVSWKCLPDGAPVYLGDLNPSGCAAGTTAVPHASLAACDDEDVPCCAAICDVNAPTCDAELECVPFFLDEDAGVCVTPE